MENDNQQQVKSFYRILEEGIAKLPADVRGALYRPCAVDCVKDVVLTELRRQFEECGCDLDRQYTKYGRSEYFLRTSSSRGGSTRSGIPGASARRSMPGSWTLRPIANAPAKASSMSWRSCCPAGTSGWKSSRPCCRAARNAVSGSLSGSSLRRPATLGRVRCAGVGRWLPAKIKIPKPMLRDFSIGYSAV